MHASSITFLTATTACFLNCSALAGPRTSASYAIPTEAAVAGSGRTTSAAYTMDSTIGDVTGISTAVAPPETLKHGYIGQLYDVTGLTLNAANISFGETGTDQLAASQTLDDSTVLAVPASAVTWSVQGGPLSSINTNGLATAGTVYQNTPATVQGTYQGQTGMTALTVLDTIPDNFGIYAGDGLPDGWQVQNFGLNNPNAAPGADPDGDGRVNLLEFAFGTNPNVSDSGALQYTGTFASAAMSRFGDPVAMFESIPTGIDFRALFVRRDDYASGSTYAGLTYTVQFSADLMSWTNSTAIPTVLADNGTYQLVGVPYPLFLNGKKARFFRVQVSTPP